MVKYIVNFYFILGKGQDYFHLSCRIKRHNEWRSQIMGELCSKSYKDMATVKVAEIL